ncbi:hypothetical protein D3C81_1552580 [compost metagenome]
MDGIGQGSAAQHATAEQVDLALAHRCVAVALCDLGFHMLDGRTVQGGKRTGRQMPGRVGHRRVVSSASAQFIQQAGTEAGSGGKFGTMGHMGEPERSGGGR